MELKYWWLGLGFITVAIIVSALRWRLAARAGRGKTDDLLAANLDRLRQTQRFKVLARRQLLMLLVLGLSLLVAVIGAGLLISRLMSVSTTTVDQRGKDIVLCLDTSNSVEPISMAAMDAYAAITDGLTTERVGLVFWNTSARTIFPLTNDHEFISEELTAARNGLENNEYEYLGGTIEGISEFGSSLIGDGLASCVGRFDQLDTERPRTLVFVSDNEVGGTPVYQLSEAMDLAVERGILVYCLAPHFSHNLDLKPELVELGEQCRRTGGDMMPVTDAEGPTQILEAISRQEAVVHASQPKRIENDLPMTGMILLGLGLAGLQIAGWRVRA